MNRDMFCKVATFDEMRELEPIEYLTVDETRAVIGFPPKSTMQPELYEPFKAIMGVALADEDKYSATKIGIAQRLNELRQNRPDLFNSDVQSQFRNSLIGLSMAKNVNYNNLLAYLFQKYSEMIDNI